MRSRQPRREDGEWEARASMKRSAVYRVSAGFTAQIIALAASTAERFVAAGVLVRVWGVELFADWAVLAAAAGLAALAELGTNVSFSNRYQILVARGDRAGLQREVGVALTVSSVLSVLAFSIFVLFSLWLQPSNIFLLAATKPTIATIVLLFFVLDYVIRLPSGAITEVYRATGKFARSQVLYTAVSVGRIVIFTCVGLMNMGQASTAILLIIPSFVVFYGIFLLDVRRNDNIKLRFAMPSGKEMGEIFHTSAWYAAQSWTLQLWIQVPPLVILYLAGSGPLVASFVLLRTLANSVRQVPALFATAASIEIVHSYFENARSVVSERLLQTGIFTSALSGLVAGFLLGFADLVIFIWTGKSELFDPVLLSLLVVPLILIAPAIPLQLFLHYGNFARQIGTGRILQLLLMLFCVIPMTSALGVYGCALGLAVSETAALAGYLLVVGLRGSGVAPVRYVGRCVAVLFSSLLISWGTAAGIRRLMEDDSLWGFAVSVSGWGVIAALPLVWFALPGTLRQRVMDQLKSGRGWR